MKFNIEQRKLSKHIGIAQKAISSRSTLQILDSILIQAKDGNLKITGTDLELSIETYVECNIEKEGAVAINSKIFGDIIRKLPSEEIYIHVDNNNVNIKCLNSEFNIQGSNPEEYPDLPIVLESESFTLPKDILKASIRQTVFATSQDETRPSLTGVLLEVSNNIASFVAIDGYRLALRKISIDSDINVKMIIPSKTLNEVNKIMEDSEENVKITLAPGHVVFYMSDTVIYSRLLEGQFFNYREIIRNDHKSSIIVDKKLFQDSLERASLLAKEEKANLIKLNVFKNEIEIKSNSEIGNVNERIDIENDGEEFNIAFNSRYILEGIKNIESEEIRLNFMGSLNPCIIEPIEDSNYTYLVLPVRLAQEDY